MSNKSKHESKKSQYTAYKQKDSAKVNKTRKLEKHLKKHPNDAVGLQAKEKGVGRTRKNPVVKDGWVTADIRTFFDRLTYVFNKNVISCKNYTTAGSENLRVVAKIVKITKKAEKSPSVFKGKGQIHPFYTRKFKTNS